jgi:D-glycero-alpha-D-manno-heptose-7-phosphate kinase
MMVLRQQAQAMTQSLETGNLAGYATALDESCRQLYQLHESCDSAEHRQYFQAIDDCIMGGKTCGAGGGGFLLLYVKPGRRHECIRRIEELGGLVWPMTIDFDGVTRWQEPSFDAEQVRQFHYLASSST